jgi:RNA polymerase sigma factor (sigma-70 family)
VRLAARRLGQPDEAEDCVHEALLRTLHHRNLDEDRIEPFLTSVVTRLCVDRFRSRTRARRVLPRAWDADQLESPEDAVCDRLTGAWMFALLDGFPLRERSILTARADGLSTTEAARRLGITQKAAESAFTRARAKMLAHVADAA